MLPRTWMTISDFGYHVLTLWLSCSQRRLNYLAFQCLLTFSVPDEGYSSNVHDEGYSSVPDEGYSSVT